MAFKKIKSSEAVPDSPEELFLDLPRRKFPDAMAHQKQIMKLYANKAIDEPDVALQLPTGSGKTLVGLLIAEWRRRKFKEKIVYLCPTKQLVNQVVEQAVEKYGITVLGFTGAKSNYNPTAKAEYQNADCVAITTYSSLFNTNPYFNDVDIIILDDAHASENYISTFWSLQIDRLNPEHVQLHTALCGVLKSILEPSDYVRLCGEYDESVGDHWVDKITTKDLYKIKDEIIEIIDACENKSDIAFTWSLIRDSLHACQIYISSYSILIRPLIPPTWTHAPFSAPKQRIYMSATLGAGGDLERLMGRKSILRLPVPGGWDKQGVGRRFFIFPEMSFDQDKIEDLRIELMKKAGRSLVLVPNNNLRDSISSEISKKLKYDIYNSRNIEESKKSFVESSKAIAIMSNRYDGIDFPGEECRLLFIEGLPQATNLQEKFIMSRMGAVVLYSERIQTRVLQAIGRCTRSLEDYSAIVVSGNLTDYFADIRKRKYFHPELQAELKFGVEQSKDTLVEDLVENFEIFLENGERWEEANKDIVLERIRSKKETLPAINELEKIVDNEIEYQTKLWQGDFLSALECTEKIIGKLTLPELKGYRALWHYLAGSVAYLGSQNGLSTLSVKAKSHYESAQKAAIGIPWLSSLTQYNEINVNKSDNKEIGMEQIEKIEIMLSDLGTVNERNYAKFEKYILDGILGGEHFEDSQKKLGELLGFNSGKKESEGSPDPWWISGDICFVFEDHADAEDTSILDTKKARQVSSHPAWMKEHVVNNSEVEIVPVLVTPVKKVSEGAWPHLDNVFIWSIENFRDWAKNALSIVREIRKSFVEVGDLEWRVNALKMFKDNEIDSLSLYKMIKKQEAKKFLKK